MASTQVEDLVLLRVDEECANLQADGHYLEALDYMESSLLPGLSARRGTPGHTPGAGGATQLTVSSTPASGASVPGSVPGSAATSEGGADGVPLIARIPEETLRASSDADDGASA